MDRGAGCGNVESLGSPPQLRPSGKSLFIRLNTARIDVNGYLNYAFKMGEEAFVTTPSFDTLQLLLTKYLQAVSIGGL